MNYENNVALMIFIIFVLCLFVSNAITFVCKILLLFIIFIFLFPNVLGIPDNQINAEMENFDSYKNREKRIDDLNDSRGKTGNFYVKCHPCGQKRILEYREKICKNCFKREYCIDAGKEEKNQTMSFFNERYVDTNQTFCYNCLLDNTQNNQYFLKNGTYWPDIDDSINGPPNV